MVFPRFKLVVNRGAGGRLIVGKDTNNYGFVYMGSAYKRAVFSVPTGVNVFINKLGGVENEYEVTAPKKQPEICIEYKDGRRVCNYDIGKDEILKAFMGYSFENLAKAVRLFKKAYSKGDEVLRGIVDRFVIVDGIERYSPNATAIMNPVEGGRCEILIDEDFLEFSDEKKIAKVIAHEVAHCIENYARSLAGGSIRASSGGWVREGEEVVPVGFEERAEKFASRVKKRLGEE